MPPVFLAWLSENRVDPRVYTLNTKLPRYVRRNPRLPQPSAAEISAQLGTLASDSRGARLTHVHGGIRSVEWQLLVFCGCGRI